MHLLEKGIKRIVCIIFLFFGISTLKAQPNYSVLNIEKDLLEKI